MSSAERRQLQPVYLFFSQTYERKSNNFDENPYIFLIFLLY
ncbi:hypothetical protein HMPREF3213_00463 [Heyndrickxia coagulans]|uniref:Uncharacterized protein n=1 Tax=Heyndrickxia coagulans TaxID=1398 RepID=A0A133L0A2_HEYCO|nr:hypothetical protein HMPREF3213_00463 [Heyndrickxia coagulans]